MSAAGRRTWALRLVGALLAALVVNAALSALEIAHDTVLITLLALATATVGTLALEALDTLRPPQWTVRRSDAQPGPGEDTRTATFRHLLEVHQTSREGDDSVLWQLGELAQRRLRQVHGLRYRDDPERAAELLGPLLTDWVTRDRRQRYQPQGRRSRHSVQELEDVVRRIEAL